MMTKSLKQLLQEVDKMFPKHDQLIDTFSYGLGRMGCGYWQFTVYDSWHKWTYKKLKSDFGLYREPEYAVEAFLTYIKQHKVNVRRLMEKPPTTAQLKRWKLLLDGRRMGHA